MVPSHLHLRRIIRTKKNENMNLRYIDKPKFTGKGKYNDLFKSLDEISANTAIEIADFDKKHLPAIRYRLWLRYGKGATASKYNKENNTLLIWKTNDKS